MASVHLGSTYKRYKLGTEKVVTWLSTTARKVAKRSGEGLRLGKKLTTKDLVRLAEIIGSGKPPVEVPADVWTATSDVIRGRTWCADFFEELGKGQPQNSKNLVEVNKSHRHFIAILEEVKTLLKDLKVDHGDKSRNKNAKSIGKKVITFNILELEEPDELLEAIDVPSYSPSPATPPSGSDPDPPLEGDFMEGLTFAVWCAFHDMREIRLHLQKVWRQYYEGELSFLAASLITDSAFRMILDIDCTLHESYEVIDCYDAISELLGIEFCEIGGQTTFYMNYLNDIKPRASAKAETINPDELFCAPAWNIVQDLRMATRDAKHPDKKTGFTFSNHPFAATLRGFASTLQLMRKKSDLARDHLSVKGFLVDWFTYGLMQTTEGGEIPVYVVPQCQIMMDIMDTLGMQPNVGNDELQAFLEQSSVDTRIQKYLNLGRSLAVPDQARIERARIERARIERQVAPYLPDIKKATPNMPSVLVGEHPWPNDRHPEKLLPALPNLAGFRLRHIVLGGCHSHLHKANQAINILAAAYVYRAAQNFGLISGTWADMEAVIAGQAVHGQYVREADSIEGYARHFAMAIGVPASAFARNSVRAAHLPSSASITANMKKLRTPSSFMLSALEVEDVPNLTEMSAFYRCLHLTAQKVYDTSPKSGRQINLTPLELLQALQKSIVDDEVLVKFDYNGFDVRCKQLLLNAKLGADFAGVDLMERAKTVINNSEAATIFYDTLLEAADVEKTGGSGNAKVQTRLAKMAADINMWIHLDSDSYLSPARMRSSGHIEKSDMPCNRWKWGDPNAKPHGPETTMEAKQRQEDVKDSLVKNRACKQFRDWKNAGMPEPEALQKLEPWINTELEKAGLHHMECESVNLDKEYDTIWIATQHKKTWMDKFMDLSFSKVLDELPELEEQ